MRFLESNEFINNYLCEKDEKFKVVIENCKFVKRDIGKDYFTAMVDSIIGQQLANTVAEILRERLIDLCEGQITANKILELEPQVLRNIGLSYSKVNYIKEFSNAVINKNIDLDIINELSNEEIINNLTSIKGIGPWTAEMFLIFALGREDIFSIGDGGLRKAVEILYNSGEKLTKKEIIEISGKWKPYRTYASIYLWKYISINK